MSLGIICGNVRVNNNNSLANVSFLVFCFWFLSLFFVVVFYFMYSFYLFIYWWYLWTTPVAISELKISLENFSFLVFCFWFQSVFFFLLIFIFVYLFINLWYHWTTSVPMSCCYKNYSYLENFSIVFSFLVSL